MVDFATASLWDLAYNLDPTDKDLCASIDVPLASKLEDMDMLLEIYYYLCYGDIHKLLPETKKKVNELLSGQIKSETETQWWQFKNFASWLDDDLKSTLVNEWLDNDEIDLDDGWMVESLKDDTDTNIKVLTKLTRMYKKKKSANNIKIMERIFIEFDKDRIDEACALLAKSTPAVAATLLRRNDIPDKYTITGLRSISKLSKQRDIDIRIDFDMLKHLGPKGRLDAMKQLMGMFDKYYQFKRDQVAMQKANPVNYNNYGNSYKERKLKLKAVEFRLPFKEVPKREDIERFLFPCSLKYNDEVVSMIERFDELISQKEER